eukprot:TRINITY_DN2378_c0_g1_i8.p1 TRINITY_DN2378_c0_g1~~TRINITY_DN2378_c0_g1_i8.p1  ORF type:complete len:279 (+),score=66.04 TRINITY_DN2378_c0_g1_i8:174-1010(+)
MCIRDRYGNVSGTWTPQGKDVFDMQAEILARGPIGCSIAPAAIFNYSSGIVRWPSSCCLNITYDVETVVDHTTVTTSETKNSCSQSVSAPHANCSLHHAVSIVGWGEEAGVKYWEARNSWGNFWGEDGFMRVEMGKNVIGIETDCSFAVPKAWGKPPLVAGRRVLSDGYKNSMSSYNATATRQFWMELTGYTPSTSSSDGGLSAGAVAAIVLSVLAVVAGLGVGGWCWWRRDEASSYRASTKLTSGSSNRYDAVPHEMLVLTQVGNLDDPGTRGVWAL